MNIDIPGVLSFDLKHVFIDYNGTVAHEGNLLPGILKQIETLSSFYKLHILTGDTYGTVRTLLTDESIDVILAYTAKEKLSVIKGFNPSECICIGNGSIDALMLKESAVGICVIGKEGCSSKAILNADIVVNNIFDAFSIISHPNQLIATLKE